MSDFISNFGTVIKIGTGTGTITYTNIKGQQNVPGLETEQETLDVTHHDQGHPYREQIPSGLIDISNFSFDILSDRSDSTQQTLYSLYKSGELGHFKLCHPDGLAQAFDAYVINMVYNETDATSPAPVLVTVTLAIKSDITETDESL